MSTDVEFAPVCLDTPAELPDLADFFKAQAYQTAAQLAQARMEIHQFRHRLIAAGLLEGSGQD